jgi:hypothetical protein
MSLSELVYALSVIDKLSILFFNFVINLTLSLNFEISRQCLRYLFKLILLIAIISSLRHCNLLRFAFHSAFVLPAQAILTNFVFITIIVTHFLNLYFSFASTIFLRSLLINSEAAAVAFNALLLFLAVRIFHSPHFWSIITLFFATNIGNHRFG